MDLSWIKSFLQRRREPRFDSPAEERFWRRANRLRSMGMVGQHRIAGYRVDFAIPKKRIVIEIDGYGYHTGRRKFAADAIRQRRIQKAGWTVIRLSGADVYRSVKECEKDVIAIMKARPCKK